MSQVYQIVLAAWKLSEEEVDNLPFHKRNYVKYVCEKGTKYLEDVQYFIDHQSIKEGKLLSFHADEVKCISKGKLGIPFEFGRAYQLYRCKGNYLGIVPPESVLEADTNAIKKVIESHQKTFGEKRLKSIATDKRYYSKFNISAAQAAEVEEIGIQVYKNSKRILSKDKERELYDRRSGIEALIGCVKNNHSFGQSRMRKDSSTVNAAIRSVIGFNLKKLLRDGLSERKKLDGLSEQWKLKLEVAA